MHDVFSRITALDAAYGRMPLREAFWLDGASCRPAWLPPGVGILSFWRPERRRTKLPRAARLRAARRTHLRR